MELLVREIQDNVDKLFDRNAHAGARVGLGLIVDTLKLQAALNRRLRERDLQLGRRIWQLENAPSAERTPDDLLNEIKELLACLEPEPDEEETDLGTGLSRAALDAYDAPDPRQPEPTYPSELTTGTPAFATTTTDTEESFPYAPFKADQFVTVSGALPYSDLEKLQHALQHANKNFGEAVAGFFIDAEEFVEYEIARAWNTWKAYRKRKNQGQPKRRKRAGDNLVMTNKTPSSVAPLPPQGPPNDEIQEDGTVKIIQPRYPSGFHPNGRSMVLNAPMPTVSG